MVVKAQPAQMVVKVLKGLRVFREQLVAKVLPAHRERLAHRVRKVFRERRESKARRVLLAHREAQVRKERLARKEVKDHREVKVVKARKVTKGHREPKVLPLFIPLPSERKVPTLHYLLFLIFHLLPQQVFTGFQVLVLLLDLPQRRRFCQLLHLLQPTPEAQVKLLLVVLIRLTH